MTPKCRNFKPHGKIVFELKRPGQTLRGWYDEKCQSGNYPYTREDITADGVDYEIANNPCIFEGIPVYTGHSETFDSPLLNTPDETALALRQLLKEINRPVGGTKAERDAQLADYDKAVAAAQAALKKAGVEY